MSQFQPPGSVRVVVNGESFDCNRRAESAGIADAVVVCTAVIDVADWL